MTLSTLYLGNYSTIVYIGHAGFLVSTVFASARGRASIAVNVCGLREWVVRKIMCPFCVWTILRHLIRVEP